MHKIWKKLKDLTEPILTFLGGTICIASLTIFLVLFLKESFPLWILSIGMGVSLIGGFCVLFLAAARINYSIYKDSANFYEKAYKDVLTQYNNDIARLQKYNQDVQIVVSGLSEKKEILPQEAAILSNLVENAVRAHDIQSIMEFSRSIMQNDSILLVRVDHDTATWHLKITGRSIDVEQAKFVMDRIKVKLEEMSHNDTLVRKSRKIYN